MRFMDGRGPLHDVGLILAVGREPQQEAATVIISLTNGRVVSEGDPVLVHDDERQECGGMERAIGCLLIKGSPGITGS